jgi:serine-type D-Ala-D-Ala carboxypeptidase/endopeptidase
VRQAGRVVYKLPWAPGTVAAYSNVGFDLLSEALAASGGKDHQTLLRDRITGPLAPSSPLTASTLRCFTA